MSYLACYFATDGNEKQDKEKIVHVPDEVQHSHVEQLVTIDERPEQSERTDDSDDEAQSNAKCDLMNNNAHDDIEGSSRRTTYTDENKETT